MEFIIKYGVGGGEIWAIVGAVGFGGFGMSFLGIGDDWRRKWRNF